MVRKADRLNKVQELIMYSVITAFLLALVVALKEYTVDKLTKLLSYLSSQYSIFSVIDPALLFIISLSVIICILVYFGLIKEVPSIR